MAITFIGAGVQEVKTGSGLNSAAAWPDGYTAVAGDVAVLIGAGKHNNGSSLAPSDPDDYTQVATSFREVGTYDLQVTVWTRILRNGEARPRITVPAAYSTTSGGLSAQVAVFRGVDGTTPEDVTAAVSSAAAATTWTPTGVTTATNGAWVLSIVASADDNALDLSAAQGFTLRMSGADYDTTAGGDHAVGLATDEVDTAGTPTMCTWNQSMVGADAWVGITMSLRPAAVSVAIVPIIQSYTMRRR